MYGVTIGTGYPTICTFIKASLHTRFVFQKIPFLGTVRNNLFVWLMMLPDLKLEGEEVDPMSFFPDFSCFCNCKPVFIQAMLTD